jgi:hypothetical protein
MEKNTGCFAITSTPKPKIVVSAEISTEAVVTAVNGGRPRQPSSLLATKNTL